MADFLARLSRLKAFVEGHPLLWTVAWRAMHRLPFLLPHDPTYYAIRHLVPSADGLILDIGANQGISALSFHKICPRCRIVSFEPNPAHAPKLEEVKGRIGPVFSYYMVGLGDAPGEFTLHTPFFKNIPLHTFSSFSEESVSGALDESYCESMRDRITIRRDICKVMTLDSLSLAPDVIKIDAEGLEPQILAGGENTLREHMPCLIFEACHGNLDAVISLLNGFGYKILSYDTRADTFADFVEGGAVANVSGLRNLIAVSGSVRQGLLGS